MIHALLLAAAVAGAQAPPAEVKVVEYLKAQVRPGEAVEVSRLVNEVFVTPEERTALSRLFDAFFRLPLFLAQHQQRVGRPPRLEEISEQFAFSVPGEADLLLRIMEADPRMPRFVERDAGSGEIRSVHVDRVLADPRFSKATQRMLAGWEGRPAPPFAVSDYDGRPFASSDVAGKPHLLYFWFTGCPPCVRTSPLLAQLGHAYAAKGFRVVGLNADRLLELPYSDEQRRAYAREHGLSFTLARLTAEMQEAYGSVSVFPTLFFVDANGTIVAQLVGQQDKAALEAAIRRALE